MIYGVWHHSVPEWFIIGVPGKKNERDIRYLGEKRQDRLNLSLFKRVKNLLDIAKPGEIFEGFQGRRTERDISL